jgi:hypothetical protein
MDVSSRKQVSASAVINYASLVDAVEFLAILGRECSAKGVEVAVKV